MRTRPHFLRGLRRLRPRDGAILVLWIGLAVALEVLGPRLGPDMGLVLALIAAFLVARTTARLHAQSPLAWLATLRRAAARLAPSRAPWKLELGLDLRGDPPVPRAWPLVLAAPLFGTAALALALLPHGAAFPAAIAELAEHSFVLYCAVAGLLLAALLAGGAFFALVAILTVRERLRRRAPHAALVVGTLVVCLATPLFSYLHGPRWLPLVGPLVALLVASSALLARGTGEVALLWRPRGHGGLASLPALAFTGAQLALGALLAVVLSVLSVGATLFPADDVRPALADDDGASAILPLVGFLFSWCACFGLLALSAVLSRWLRARLAAWRAERAPVCLHLSNVRGSAERRAIARKFAAWDVHVRFAPRTPLPHAVPARWVDRAEDTVRDPLLAERLTEPLALGVADLDRAATAERVRRRDVRQDRARLLHGIARLLRAAQRNGSAGREGRGEGFWLGPQHWFLSGMGRDRQGDEDALRDGLFEPRAGAGYAEALDWHARAHLLAVCRDLAVDLVFVQDGVRFGGVRRVFETLFEVHDVFGGARRIEERDFAGLVGLRVVLHDFELGRPLRRAGYPEPDYEDLARARVLHVFRDRGGREEVADRPLDLVDLPQPALG